MAEEFNTPVTPLPPQTPRKSNTTTIIIIVVAVLALLCCCCIAAGVALSNAGFFDPNFYNF